MSIVGAVQCDCSVSRAGALSQASTIYVYFNYTPLDSQAVPSWKHVGNRIKTQAVWQSLRRQIVTSQAVTHYVAEIISELDKVRAHECNRISYLGAVHFIICFASFIAWHSSRNIPYMEQFQMTLYVLNCSE